MKFRSRIVLKKHNRPYYLIGFLSLLIIEILIARFIKDDFIRPYFGDFLVVILIYSFLMSFGKISAFNALICVLLFSVGIELLQLIDIVEFLGFEPPGFVMIVLGSSFSWLDILAYLLGLLSCLLFETWEPKALSSRL